MNWSNSKRFSNDQNVGFPSFDFPSIAPDEQYEEEKVNDIVTSVKNVVNAILNNKTTENVANATSNEIFTTNGTVFNVMENTNSSIVTEILRNNNSVTGITGDTGVTTFEASTELNNITNIINDVTSTIKTTTENTVDYTETSIYTNIETTTKNFIEKETYDYYEPHTVTFTILGIVLGILIIIAIISSVSYSRRLKKKKIYFTNQAHVSFQVNEANSTLSSNL